MRLLLAAALLLALQGCAKKDDCAELAKRAEAAALCLASPSCSSTRGDAEAVVAYGDALAKCQDEADAAAVEKGLKARGNR